VKQDIKKIATPSVLRKSVEVYRIGKGTDCKYLLHIPWEQDNLPMEMWQFYILEVLSECSDFEALRAVFHDRFGHPLAVEDAEALIATINTKKLFSAGSLELPILSAVNSWGTARLAPTVPPAVVGATALKSDTVSGSPVTTQAISSSGGALTQIKPEPDRAGVDPKHDPIPGLHGTVGLDQDLSHRGFKLFNPTWLLRLLMPIMRPLRHSVYLLPLLLIAAGYICAAYRVTLVQDVMTLFESVSLLEHALISLLTVNLAVTLLRAMVALNYSASVDGFCLVFYMYFFPRFTVRIGSVQQLSRRDVMWLHASPLLLRLGIFAGGILIWYYSRTRYDAEGFLILMIAAAGAISFLITANPLVKSSGYQLLAAFVNEPRLRGKSFRAFMNKFGANVYKQADQNILVAYTLASMLFMLIFMTAMVLVLRDYVSIYFGEGSILVALLLGLLLLWRIIVKFREIGKVYERSIQYQQWRNRTLPQKEYETSPKEKSSGLPLYVRRSLLVVFLAALFIPYRYEVGGNFKVLPNMQQYIASELSGIIENVNYDGGEFVQKGTVIGQLTHNEYIAQEKVYTAKVEEQQAVIQKLKSQPRSEELQLALSELETQKTRTDFSKAKAERLQKLYLQGTVSFEDLEEARKEYEVDNKRILEKTLNYQLIKAGAPADEIKAAEAKLKAYEEERDHFRDRIAKSIFYMPFDGKIVTTRLKDKIGSYLNKGEALAMVENVNLVKAEIEVPEADIVHVRKDATVRIRSLVHHQQDLVGSVALIEENVTERRYGQVVKVVTMVNNSGEVLKTGMTGYAKIDSERMPLWKVLSMPLVRFARVHLWSWIP
jgi:putative peptide zinc metalloprotease protein